jgi:hypothetical protein
MMGIRQQICRAIKGYHYFASTARTPLHRMFNLKIFKSMAWHGPGGQQETMP